MIIGVCGLIGAGKDTIADYLVNIHEFRRDSFAATLKDACAAVFGWDRNLLEGRTKSSREWREQPDEWWSQRLGMNITPRWVLQHWGTEVCRQNFHDDIWIASLENKLRTTKDNIVISDCRFSNEIHAIREAGGIVIRVVRGEDPEWFTGVASMYGKATTEQKADYMKKFSVHASEWSWVGTEFNHVLDNNGSLDQLYKQVTHLVQDHQLAKVSLAA